MIHWTSRRKEKAGVNLFSIGRYLNSVESFHGLTWISKTF